MDGRREVLLSNVTAKAGFIIQGMPARMEEKLVPGWHMGILHFGPTDFMDELMVHVGVLDGHLTPHPPHRHDHEELHFSLSDELEYVFRGDDSTEDRILTLAKGSVSFTDSNELHTVRNAGDAPASYLHIRWKRKSPTGFGRPGLHFSHPGPRPGGADPGIPPGERREIEIYSGPTLYFPKITLRGVALAAGGGVPLHRHDHEVAFALVEGAAEILGRRVDAPGFAFMGSRVPHCLHNPGPAPAIFYAVEFHRPS